jgi:elongation factor P
MLSASELRNGTSFVKNGDPFRVVKYKHTHISRGGANIKVKAKNLKSGNVRTFTFGSKDKFEEAFLQRKKMQFLYEAQGELVFMDMNTYQQKSLDKEKFPEAAKFLQEGEEFYIIFYEDEILEIDLPTTVELKVKQTPPGAKGNTAASATKKATLENGLVVKVPLFVKQGEKIVVDTRTSEYIERA